MFGDSGAIGSAGMALMIAGAALFALSLIHSFFSPATGAIMKIAGIILLAVGLLLVMVIGPSVKSHNDNTSANTPPVYTQPQTYTSPPPPPPYVYSSTSGSLPPGYGATGSGTYTYTTSGGYTVTVPASSGSPTGAWGPNGGVGVASGTAGGSLGVESGVTQVHLTVDGTVAPQSYAVASSGSSKPAAIGPQ